MGGVISVTLGVREVAGWSEIMCFMMGAQGDGFSLQTYWSRFFKVF